MSKILSLLSENVKRISVVEIKPDGNLVVIGGKNGQGKCIPEGTLVSLWNGTRKPIERIRETDLLVGLNPNTWALVPEHPLGIATNGVKEIFELSTRCGHSIRATSNHRLLSFDSWKELGAFSVGDYIAVPMRLPGGGIEGQTSIDEAMLIGLLLGDGCLTEGFAFSCGNEDIGILFGQCVRRLFPDSVIRRWPKANSNGWTLGVSKGTKRGRLKSKALAWLERLGMRGCNAYTKQVPDFIFAGTQDVLSNCLAGLLMTDGHVQTNGQATYYTRSEALVDAARHLMLRLGIPNSVRSRTVTDRPFYRVSVVTATGRAKMRDLVLPLIPVSKLRPGKMEMDGGSQTYGVPPFVVEKLLESGASGARSWIRGRSTMSRDRLLAFCGELGSVPETIAQFVSPDVGWDTIESVVSVGEHQTFDLQMPSEAFIANDFIVHNSSVLDSIEFALGGDPNAKMPVRRGEERARIVVDLGDIVVKRTFTAAGGTSLVVMDADGKKQTTPQAILDKMVGKLTFDPLAFARQKPREQADTLRVLIGLDFEKHDENREQTFAQRTIINRDAKAIEARINAIPKAEGLPEKEESAANILGDQKRAAEANQRNADLRRAAQERRKAVSDLNATAIESERDLARLEEELAGAKKTLEQAKANLASAQKAVAEADKDVEGLVDTDLKQFQDRIEKVEETNRMVRKARERSELVKQFKVMSEVADRLTNKINDLDSSKRKAVTEAKYPVEGLLFDTAGGVTLNGIPFSQCSAAEQLKVSIAVGIALNPKLRVLLCRDASLLDDDNMRVVAEMAQKHDIQIWLEKVGTDAQTSVVIEDGHVKSGDVASTEKRVEEQPQRTAPEEPVSSDKPQEGQLL